MVPTGRDDHNRDESNDQAIFNGRRAPDSSFVKRVMKFDILSSPSVQAV